MIGLTHDTGLWRVQLALSGLNSAVSSVLVEKSFNEVLWSTVRGGTTLPISSGSGSLDDYEYAASADGSLTTFYRVTTVDPPPGLLLDGTAGSYASTPDDASLDITGDIVLAVDATLDDWLAAGTQTLIAKYNSGGDNRSFRLLVEDGALVFESSEDGVSASVNETSTETVEPDDDGRLAVMAWLNVDDGDGNRGVNFYTAPRLADPDSSEWVKLGSTITEAGTTSIFDSTANLNVGATQDDGSGTPATGNFHGAFVVDGNRTGTVVADPDFTAEPSGTASFDDDAGRTWTLNGDAEIVTFETASIAVTQSDYVAKSIRYPLLNRSVKIGDYSDLERPAQLGVHAISGRSFPVATTDVNSSVRFQMEFVTETEDEARRLKLLFALGDILYLQSPAEVNTRRPPRSMYVVADSSAVGRIGTGTYRRHTVPFTEVAAPSPLVTGATLTWAHVFAQFGNWHQLITANPTWFDLLQTVGDPEDLVVL